MLMNSVVKRMISSVVFIRPVAGFAKHYVHTIIDESSLTGLYAQRGGLERSSTSEQIDIKRTEKSVNTSKRESCKKRRSEKKKRSSRRSQSPKRSKSSKFSISRSRSLRRRDQKLHRNSGTRSFSSLKLSCLPKQSSRRRNAKSWDLSAVAIRPISSRYEHALDYRTYRFVDMSLNYDENVAKNISKWARILQMQMRSKTFDERNLIFVISFL